MKDTWPLSQDVRNNRKEDLKIPRAHHNESRELKFPTIYNQLTTLMNGGCDCRFLCSRQKGKRFSVNSYDIKVIFR